MLGSTVGLPCATSPGLLPHALNAEQTAQRTSQANDAIVEVRVPKRGCWHCQVTKIRCKLDVGDLSLPSKLDLLHLPIRILLVDLSSPLTQVVQLVDAC